MDLPVRPKRSNAHKPRITIVKHRGWTNYLVRVPVFLLKPDDQGGVHPRLAGHVHVARKSSLADALAAAVGIDSVVMNRNAE